MKRIPLSNGQFAKINDRDFKHISKFKWYVDKKGYAYRIVTTNGKKKKIKMHQEILGKKDGMVIDHVNLYKLDNRRDNLRFCNSGQNNQNAKPRGGSSNYLGVYLQNNSWRADARKDGMTVHLGSYLIEKIVGAEIAAAAAYNLHAIENYGEYGRINILDKPGETISIRDYLRGRDAYFNMIKGYPDDIRYIFEMHWMIQNGWASPYKPVVKDLYIVNKSSVEAGKENVA